MRVVPAGFNTSTCVVTSKLRQSLAAAVLRANGRHVLFSSGNARAAETAAVEERKSRRFMVDSSYLTFSRRLIKAARLAREPVCRRGCRLGGGGSSLRA